MNILKSETNNGLEFNWDAFRWEQDAVREAFYGLMTALGIENDEGFIITGCAVSDGGSTWNIAEGYFCFNGEICHVSAHTITKSLGGGQDHGWTILETYDADGLMPLETGGVLNTYAVREAIVTIVSTGSPYTPMLAPTIMQTLWKKLNDVGDESWVAITPLNGATASNSPSVRIARDGKVEFKGELLCGGITDSVVGNVPLGSRPEHPIYSTALYGGDASFFRIETDGDIYLSGTSATAIFLSAVRRYYPV